MLFVTQSNPSLFRNHFGSQCASPALQAKPSWLSTIARRSSLRGSWHPASSKLWSWQRAWPRLSMSLRMPSRLIDSSQRGTLPHLQLVLHSRRRASQPCMRTCRSVGTCDIMHALDGCNRGLARFGNPRTGSWKFRALSPCGVPLIVLGACMCSCVHACCCSLLRSHVGACASRCASHERPHVRTSRRGLTTPLTTAQATILIDSN